jgi:hypothetical protein
MKKYLSLILVAIALTACGKKEEKAAAANLPAECEAYSKQVAACMSKATASSKQAAEMVQKQFDQAKAGWSVAKTDAERAQLGQACKAAQEAFQVNAKAMGC